MTIKEQKMTIQELRRRQVLPLSEKIGMSQCVIEQWYDYWKGLVYISFSGGKDSTVLLDLVRKIFPEVPAVFIDTGLEYPEIKEHVRTFDNVTILRPKMSYRQVIKNYGYPIISKEQALYLFEYQTSNSEKLKSIRLEGNKWGGGKISKKWLYLIDAPFKISNRCCDVMKKSPAKSYETKTHRHGYLGNLASESNMRTETYLRYGCNMYNRDRPLSSPLSFWMEQDIFDYINKYSIKLSDIYKTETRTGCMFCAFGVHLEPEPNKFQRMKLSHPKLHKYCMEELNMKQVLDYIGIKYE